MWNEDLIWFMLYEDGDLGEHIVNHGNADHVDLGDIQKFWQTYMIK